MRRKFSRDWQECCHQYRVIFTGSEDLYELEQAHTRRDTRPDFHLHRGAISNLRLPRMAASHNHVAMLHPPRPQLLALKVPVYGRTQAD